MVETVTEATPTMPGPTTRMLAADEASRLLGIELLEHGEGTAVLRMTVTASMVNVLTATAREVTRFGRSGIYDVSVVRGETVIAEFRGRSRSIRSTETKEPQ
ncbi:hypothetical protein SRB17_17790 [Streptomyces sp. RB17]|uniref:hypothetical protein n=1 Tax=Streptomyces sp. RB17 TaxID=2585197 RepID=UPI001296231F|nr:hypothetical protein [Streptomyces sp. RB17]MQY33814.1 hypothetical protein [Streptomyces sp. RB17]